MSNLLIWRGSFAVTSNVTAATIGSHMVHQGVYQHQATRHLPSFPS
jgi:hypothetical protein